MPIFKIDKQNLVPISEKRFDLEKDIQSLTEKNLESIFGLKFICSEFQHNNLRIDTLAFDEESKSFVIIEYKKDRNISIIDQGYAYLSLLINNKADFILYYNETQQKALRKDEIDWSQTRVIFIAHSYTAHQKQAINFADMPIELWKVSKYENNIVEFDRLETPETSESIKAFSKTSGIVQRVSQEVKKYSIDDHFKKDWVKSKELFEEIRGKILEIDSKIEEKYNKFYIGYKIGFYNLCAIHIFKYQLRVDLVRVDKGDLKDPDNRIIKIPWKSRGWGRLCEFLIQKPEDIDYAIFLIKQVYEKFYK